MHCIQRNIRTGKILRGGGGPPRLDKPSLYLIYYSETVIEIAQELPFTGVKLTGVFESLASEYTLLSFRGP